MLKDKKGLFGAISLFSIDYTTRFTIEFKTFSKLKGGSEADSLETRR